MVARLRAYLELVKFQHTVFALPFALSSAVVAAMEMPQRFWVLPPLDKLLWILLAMVCARTAAMSFNRIADAKIDALNPRTKNREIPTGKVTIPQASILVILASLLFTFAAYKLNQLCFILSFPTLAWLLLYSYTKRFTALSHFWLGFALGIAPVGAWIAVKGKIEMPPVLLCLAVTLWVAGFDIIYSTLDYEFDQKVGLHSLVVRLGIEKALWVSRCLHAGFVVLLIGFGVLASLGVSYYVGVVLCSLLIAYEHAIVSPRDLRRVNVAFFTVNGAVSVFLFAMVMLDVAVRG